MKAVILMGSPHLAGTTARLSDAFADGLRLSGAEVVRIDAESLNVRPVTAGLLEDLGAGRNVDADGMDCVFDAMLAADLVVLATPLYYYGMTAQLKTVLDRFLSRNDEITKKKFKAVLLATCAGPGEAGMAPLAAQFDALCGYLAFQNEGHVFATGLAMEPLEATGALERARALGEKLGRG